MAHCACSLQPRMLPSSSRTASYFTGGCAFCASPSRTDMTPTPTSAQLAQTGKASPEPDVMAPVFPETNQRQTDARIDLKLFEPRQCVRL
jgi:hypothetical protein